MGDRHGQSNGLKIAQRVVGKRVTSAVRNVGAPVADDDRVAKRAVSDFAAEPNSGLIVTASSLATIYSKLIIDLAARYRLPAVYPNRLHVVAGGLASYGPAFLDQFRGAAD